MKIVIVGSGGRLGAALARAYENEHEIERFDHAQLDFNKLDEMRATFADLAFDLLINCAALTNVDYCESHREEATIVNAEAPRILAELCKAKSVRLIHFSTDYVFEGTKQGPYTEDDEARPLSVYGESKLRGERHVLGVSEDFLVTRVSWVFGPDRPSFIDQVISRARQNTEVAAVADKFSTPSYTLDVAQWLETAWEKKLHGILHLANEGMCSWQAYAQHALDCCRRNGMQLQAAKVLPLRLAEMKNFVARRPVNSVLSTAKFSSSTEAQPRSWRAAVAEYITNYVAKL